MKLSTEDKVVIDAIKKSATEHTIDWAKETECEDDQVFCENNGVVTVYIAKELDVEINSARRILDKLAKRRIIAKSKNNGGCYCRWWPVGYLAEIKANVNN